MLKMAAILAIAGKRSKVRLADDLPPQQRPSRATPLPEGFWLEGQPHTECYPDLELLRRSIARVQTAEHRESGRWRDLRTSLVENCGYLVVDQINRKGPSNSRCPGRCLSRRPAALPDTSPDARPGLEIFAAQLARPAATRERQIQCFHLYWTSWPTSKAVGGAVQHAGKRQGAPDRKRVPPYQQCPISLVRNHSSKREPGQMPG